MKWFSVFLVITTCLFVNILAQEKFNVTLKELQDQCFYNGGNFLFDKILNDLYNFRNFRNNLLGQFNAATQGSPAEGDYRSLYVINQICETNFDLINQLRQLIENVQICLNENNRLSQEKSEKILKNMINGVCLQLEFERALFTQPECLRESMASLHSPTDECSLSFPKYINVYTLEPIPIVYSDEECSDFVKAGDCRITTRKNCDTNLKAIIKHGFNITLGLIYC